MGIGGNGRQQRKSSSSTGKFSFFNLFKMGSRPSRKASSGDTSSISTSAGEGKAWPSDEDKGRYWVAEPGIDRKAKAYIDKIHQIRVSETERQTFTLHP